MELIKQWYVVPTPEQLRERGPYQPATFLAEHGKQERVLTVKCASEPDAQPTNELRRRHGLPEVPEQQIRRATKPRQAKWLERQREQEQEEAREGDDG